MTQRPHWLGIVGLIGLMALFALAPTAGAAPRGQATDSVTAAEYPPLKDAGSSKYGIRRTRGATWHKTGISAAGSTQLPSVRYEVLRPE